MSLPDGAVTAAALCLLGVLSGCAGGGTGGSENWGDSEPCTPIGGERLEAVPLADENATTVTATEFDSLTDGQQAVFLRIRNAANSEEHPVPDLPGCVRHEGTVYEVVLVSLWDDCV